MVYGSDNDRANHPRSMLAQMSLHSPLTNLHQPIGDRDVNLAMIFVTSVDEFDVREVARQHVRFAFDC